MLIHQPSAAPAFEIYILRSFAQYAWAWLEDAGQEFGVRIAPAQEGVGSGTPGSRRVPGRGP